MGMGLSAWVLPYTRVSQKTLRGLSRRGAEKLRFPAPYVFNGLQLPKTALRPCTAEAVAFCDSLCGGSGPCSYCGNRR
jgi:hypothetical protein